MLLIHAGVATLRMWDPQISRSRRSITSSGSIPADTAKPRPRTSRSPTGTDALALLDHLGIVRATVIGCSRGGRIALDIAVEHPERVAGLVTIGSGPAGFPETELTEREDALFDELDDLLAGGQWEELVRRETELWTFGPTAAPRNSTRRSSRRHTN